MKMNFRFHPLINTYRSGTRARLQLYKCLGLAACLLVVCPGCSTQKLWRKSRFAPADPARLALYQSHQHADILVSYYEQRVASDRVQPRAYFLFANLTNVAGHRKPGFLESPDFNGWHTIPVFDASSATNFPSPEGHYAIISATNRVEFALHRDNVFVGQFRLPGYEAMSGVATRVLLTPLTVGLDVMTSCLTFGARAGP